LEDLGSDGKIKWITKETRLEGMDWIDLVRDKEKGLALLNALINLLVQ
jgi:hypothetical protein